MGEYYCWVNVNKKEYILPSDFDYGSKRTESMFQGNSYLLALYDLLSKEWEGDHILFLGDEIIIPDNVEIGVLKTLYEDSIRSGCLGCVDDLINGLYKNVSVSYKAAEKIVRQEIDDYVISVIKGNPLHNEYGIDVKKPFQGSFSRAGQSFRYIINHTKRLYYSLSSTKIYDRNSIRKYKVDPLPLLMKYGKRCGIGIWAGDIVGVADKAPCGYKFLSGIYLDF